MSEQTWREIFGRFDASGQPLTVFSRNEDLNTHSFRPWRRRLALPAKFIELGALPARSLVPDRLEITLELGGGVNLRLVRG